MALREKMASTKKGYFTPKNPEKYKGNSKKIYYRSSWERSIMFKLDSSPSVIWWSSEEIIIYYHNPVQRRTARYFPDFVFKNINSQSQEEIVMVEVKPLKQTQKPIKPETKDKRRLRTWKNALMTYIINISKWKAAEEYCNNKGWKFVILTEENLK